MKYYKVGDLAEALVMVEQGRKLILSKGSFYLQDPDKKDETWNAYLPAAIREELKGIQPELFEAKPEKAEINPKMLKYPPGDDETASKMSGLSDQKQSPPMQPDRQIQNSPPVLPNQIAESGRFIAPLEFILHDTERRLLETIITLENLHLLPEPDRYEIPFAYVVDGEKGQTIDDGGGEKPRKSVIRLSLADIAVRKLIETYHKWQRVREIEEERDNLQEILTNMIYENQNLQARYDEITDALAYKLITSK